MAIKRYDVVAVTGKYTDRQGQEKSRYMNCGAVFENDRGQLSIKLEGLPVGTEWNGWLNLFEPRDSRQQPSRNEQQSAPAQGGADYDDDIPFAALHWLEG